MLKNKITIIALIIMVVTIPSYAISYAQNNQIDNGGIGGRPAYPRDDNERSKSIFIHTIEPGQSQNDGIEVINNSQEDKRIQVYAVDSVKSSDGAFACAQAVDEKQSVGSWVSLTKNYVEVASFSSEVIDFTIQLPERVDAGEQNGCIVIQAESPQNQNEQGIGLTFRTAVRLAILVPGEITKHLELTSFETALEQNEIILTPTIINYGNVSVDADIQTKLKTLWGTTTSEVGGQFPVLRNDSGTWNFKHTIPEWGGWYKPVASAHYNDDHISFLGEGVLERRSISTTGKTIFIMPQPRNAVILLLLIIAALLLIYSGCRAILFKISIKRWKAYTVKPGDDIKSIASNREISWRKLAKANKLRAPYTIKPQTKIIVPPKK